MPFELQTPSENLTWSVDWDDGPWLATGDSVASASWAITPATGVTVVDLGNAANVSSAQVSGLTRGQHYRLTCTMVSTLGETGEQSIAIRCDFN